MPVCLRTSDPVVAAQPYNAPDYGWKFPHGKYWAITPQNCLAWYQHQFAALLETADSLRELSVLFEEHPVFLLRLDLLFFQTHLHNPQWTEEELAFHLAAYLLPDREHWGDADLSEEFCHR